MSSPSSEGPREEKLEVPSPHPTDVHESQDVTEGGEGCRPPSSDAPGIELKESIKVLRNPLTDETEETKEVSNEHGVDTDVDVHDVENLPPDISHQQQQPPSLISETSTQEEPTPILVTECHTVYSILAFAISSNYPAVATYFVFITKDVDL